MYRGRCVSLSPHKTTPMQETQLKEKSTFPRGGMEEARQQISALTLEPVFHSTSWFKVKPVVGP